MTRYINRRRLLGQIGALTALAAAPAVAAPARARPRVVIVGGGVGGLSVLRALVHAAGERLDITLVEPKTTYTTCFYSNLYVGGVHQLDVLQHDYAAITALPGVRVVHAPATALDLDRQAVVLNDGARLPYQRLVLSPGIALDFDSVPGWSAAASDAMPHAWQAGDQTLLLKRQLDAVPNGGLIVMIAPPNPYRCPPGPYERVSMMARALTESGRTRTRIVVLDPKQSFSKQPLFQRGWENHYPRMVEWQPPFIHGGIEGVDPATMTVETSFETYRGADLVNVIPRQTAGTIAVQAGLTGADGYCPIDPQTLKSVHDGAVFVLGDAAVAGDMPKSAYAANSQAGVVADTILQDLLDRPAPAPRFRNKCWSLIADNDSVFVGGTYQPADGRISQVDSEISSPEDSAGTRQRNYADSAGWYLELTNELFGSGAPVQNSGT